ncbi:head-tail connector protein [Aquabacterium sp. OR-4]|uniref:head-tail connector protein n=1 Tax=Aquabacterium sp. OR-4 TaxID=2978127 RepID=UPI0021B4CF87|nr:hypothetical protein [Aquabacterium sp. OR-4]MDT7836459.1 hypothetical protein [Aquabacterium sp. OR-4]
MYLLNPPTAEPVTTAEAALAARISSGDALEPMLPGLIAAARQVAEQETGRQLMEQTWRIELPDWPAADDLLHAHRATACAITYWTGSTWSQAMSASAFTFYPLSTGTGVAPAVGASWPTLGAVAGGPRVRIDLTAGADDAADVPECVKLFIKTLVAHWAYNPAAAAHNSLAEAPFLRALLDPVRLWS